MQGQEEAMQLSSKESEAETKALQEELQLVLKKEREAQKELSALRLSLTDQQTPRVDTQTSQTSPDHQVGVCIFLSQLSYYLADGMSLGRCVFTWSLSPAALIQRVLEQLASEYNKLNDALRVEKRLYQNLVQIHNKSDRLASSHLSAAVVKSSFPFFFRFCF